MRIANAFAGAAVAAILVLSASRLQAQTGAVVQPDFAGQTALTSTQIDSACAARALPLAGSAIFGGLRDILTRAGGTRVETPLPPAAATVRAVTIAAGWYLVLVVIGIAVLAFAGDRLRQVSDALERDTVGALLTGLVADLASVPLIAAAVVVLALTIIGVLLIPFAVVALVLVYAGLALLGFLAVASVIGRSLLGTRRERMTDRSVTLMGMVTGITLLLAVWLAAALFTWSPMAGLVLRSMALGLTAVVVTAGVGAVLKSFRTGTQPSLVAAPILDEAAWQTPTPVGGVVAVRRSAG